VAASRLIRVAETITASLRRGDRSPVEAVCDAASSLLEVTGSGLSLMSDGQLRGAAGPREPGIAAVHDLQFALGEGPCIDAWETREPVLAPDLGEPAGSRWPAFGRGALDAGVAAVFAFPLRMGAIRLGVLATYRAAPGPLTEDGLALGLTLADVATQLVLGLQAGAQDGRLHDLLAQEPPHWAEVHQASGMVSVQLGVSLDEAFVRLRAHAFAEGRSLRAVAADVVHRRLRLEGMR
jgi:hypothetical protein